MLDNEDIEKWCKEMGWGYRTGRVSGTLSLYNSSGLRLNRRRFDSRTKRESILKEWKHQYWERWDTFIIGISPDCNQET